jgi:anti-sigma regulatory factor (Ser/Thr protein kinase)
MRTGAAQGHAGFFHQAAFYSTDDELLELVVPFLEEGIRAGEPGVIAFGDRNAELTRAALGDRPELTFLPGADHYSRPATTIRSYTELFADLLSTGASQVRAVGDVPHPGTGFEWHGWCRYEAAVNLAFDDYAVWGLCPYDTRLTPDDVLEDVWRTHPHVATGTEVGANDRYEDPARFLVDLDAPPVEPWPSVDAVLVHPAPAEARAAVRALGERAGFGPSDHERLDLAVSELVTNALRHGEPPALVEARVTGDAVEVAVTDRGRGPDDGFAGLLSPTLGRPGGYGLWIVHQICDDVVLLPNAEGFTARATVRGGGPGPR